MTENLNISSFISELSDSTWSEKIEDIRNNETKTEYAIFTSERLNDTLCKMIKGRKKLIEQSKEDIENSKLTIKFKDHFLELSRMDILTNELIETKLDLTKNPLGINTKIISKGITIVTDSLYNFTYNNNELIMNSIQKARTPNIPMTVQNSCNIIQNIIYNRENETIIFKEQTIYKKNSTSPVLVKVLYREN